jgi:holo-[acyl-carrier protein] synthase
MIRGIGTDIVEIARIKEMIRKYGDHFLQKVFTGSEMAWCGSKAMPHIHYAGRWAAKEAFYKALPASCQKLSGWKSMEVVPTPNNAPVISVCDRPLHSAMKKCRVLVSHLSISHEKTMCVAVVVLEGGSLSSGERAFLRHDRRVETRGKFMRRKGVDTL